MVACEEEGAQRACQKRQDKDARKQRIFPFVVVQIRRDTPDEA